MIKKLISGYGKRGGEIKSRKHPTYVNSWWGHQILLYDKIEIYKLSEESVKTWVDNFRSSLNRKNQTGKETDPKDKDQE